MRGEMIDVFPPKTRRADVDHAGDTLDRSRLRPRRACSTRQLKAIDRYLVGKALDAAAITRFRAPAIDAFDSPGEDDLPAGTVAPAVDERNHGPGCRCSTTAWRSCSSYCRACVDRARSPGRGGSRRASAIMLNAYEMEQGRPGFRCCALHRRGAVPRQPGVGPARGRPPDLEMKLRRSSAKGWGRGYGGGSAGPSRRATQPTSSVRARRPRRATTTTACAW